MAEVGIKSVIEYVEETTFGTLPSDPNMQWIGLVTKFKPVDKLKTTTIRYFGDDSQTDGRLENIKNAKVGREVGLEISYVPQSLPGFLKYWTGSATGLSDDIPSISVGIIDKNATKYTVINGLIGNEVTLTIPEDGEVTVEGNMVGVEIDTSDTDYIGAGSHATEDSGDPLTSEDLTLIQMDTGGGFADITDYVNSIKVTIANTLGVFKDLGSSFSTKIGAIKPVAREVKVSLEMDYEDFTMLNNVRSFTSLGLKFTLGGKTFTFTGVRFPEAPFEYKPDDLIGDTLESLPVEGMTIA